MEISWIPDGEDVEFDQEAFIKKLIETVDNIHSETKVSMETLQEKSG